LDGIVVINKPEGWTSHDVVAKVRGIAGTRRVGHLGTLDPIATGVLPVMIGQATRLAQFWERSEKTYEAKIRFGFATTTYDRASEPVGPVTSPSISREELEAALEPMRGEIEQVPPPVSAKKVKGVPAYKLARAGALAELAPVKVTVFELEVLDAAEAACTLRVRCSAGTYIRAMAHEVGQRLGCGAHVEELVRTQAGPFRIDQAWTLEKLQGHVEEAMVPAAELLPQFPPVYVDEETISRIRQGRDFTVSPFRVNAGTAHVKAIDRAGRLVAIGKIMLPHVYHPVIVLN
jgi:tRNA pseudouridine55 synthase